MQVYNYINQVLTVKQSVEFEYLYVFCMGIVHVNMLPTAGNPCTYVTYSRYPLYTVIHITGKL